jgi:hypothetical protein
VNKVNGQGFGQGIRMNVILEISTKPIEVTRDTRQTLMPKCARVVERNDPMQNIHIECTIDSDMVIQITIGVC